MLIWKPYPANGRIGFSRRRLVGDTTIVLQLFYIRTTYFKRLISEKTHQRCYLLHSIFPSGKGYALSHTSITHHRFLPQITDGHALCTDWKELQTLIRSSQARKQLPPPPTPCQQLLRLPPLLPSNSRLHRDDSRRPERTHRLPHQPNPGVLLPIPRIHAPPDRRQLDNPASLPGYSDPRGFAIPPTGEYAALSRAIPRHGRCCLGDA